MPRKSLSLFDLIDLPEEQRQLVLYLIDDSPQSTEYLAEHFSLTLAELEPILKALLKEDYITCLSDGSYEASLGQRSSSSSANNKKSSSFMDSLLDNLIESDEG